MGEIKVLFTCFKCYYMMVLTCPFNTFACFCATRFPCFLLWCLLCAFVPFPRLLTICPTLSAFTCDLFPPRSQSTLCGYLTSFSVIYPRLISKSLPDWKHHKAKTYQQLMASNKNEHSHAITATSWFVWWDGLITFPFIKDVPVYPVLK